MTFAIDIGNTYSKIAVFEGENILRIIHSKEIDLSLLKELKCVYPFVSEVILSSVGHCPAKIKSYLKKEYRLWEFDENLRFPIKNAYKTPETLGKDRLAAAVGASQLFPFSNNLIIDAGTCITFDFIDEENTYHGGSILPGMNMKFEALHTFTKKLPLLHRKNNTPSPIIGRNTKESIQSGILNGTLFEINGFIDYYARTYSNLNVIITGGDYKYFEKNINFRKFAIPNLVLVGLNVILLFNVENKSA